MEKTRKEKERKAADTPSELSPSSLAHPAAASPPASQQAKELGPQTQLPGKQHSSPLDLGQASRLRNKSLNSTCADLYSGHHSDRQQSTAPPLSCCQFAKEKIAQNKPLEELPMSLCSQCSNSSHSWRPPSRPIGAPRPHLQVLPLQLQHPPPPTPTPNPKAESPTAIHACLALTINHALLVVFPIRI